MAITTVPGSVPSPSLVFETLNAYQRSAALRAAIELDLFRYIGPGSADAASLARNCSASERGIRILCDFLTVDGLLLKEDGRYQHSPTSAVFLDPRSPACMSSISRFIGTAAMQEPYAHLADIVRSGRTSLAGEGNVEPEHPMWVDFAHAMTPMMAPMSAHLAALVLEGRSGPLRVLDIAAGHGLFGIAVAQQETQARVTAVDWAPVLEVAKSNAHKAGVADRYETLAGSAFTVEYGGPYDILLLTNFLHHFDMATCTQLLKRLRASSKPGACVAALEFVPNADRVSPPMPATFSLTMLVGTPGGDAYTFAELAQMYTDAGFTQITQHPIPMSPETAVIGRA